MTKVITPEAIISYPHVFEPQRPPGASEPVYSCCLVFPDGTDMSELKAVAASVAKEKWGDKTKSLMEGGKIRMPFRNDGEEKGYPEGSVFMNVKSKQAPFNAKKVLIKIVFGVFSTKHQNNLNMGGNPKVKIM